MADNNVTLVGGITRDPELRYTTGGQGVAGFGLAVNRRYQQNGEWQEQVSFFDITAWGTLGENCAASLRKGMRVVVTGRLDQRQWDKDGEKRSKVEVVADEVAPSLRWATCEVSKVERTDTSQDGPRDVRRDPPRTVGGGGPSNKSTVYDEEPF